jgi:threonine dehydratase
MTAHTTPPATAETLPPLPTYADVEAAAKRLAGVAHRTPVLTSRTANARLGASLFFKAENLQRAGAFKFRGAYNALACFTPEQKAAGVVAFSSGNHAQGVALAARLLGIPAVIVMPEDAPAAKVAATREYGAEVVLFDRYKVNREEVGDDLSKRRGLTLVPPFDHSNVVAGQGTAAKELIEETGPLDVLLVCTGGGGLLAGCALAAEALSPGCKVYGVEPAAGNDVEQSLKAGRRIGIPVPRTIADGAQTTLVGAITFPIIQRTVAGVVSVPDEDLIACMRFYAERMKIVVEPTGCLSLAAATAGKVDVAGKRVGLIISGGNVDMTAFARFLTG